MAQVVTWEYTICTGWQAVVLAGASGWELVSAIYRTDNGSVEYYMKRQVTK